MAKVIRKWMAEELHQEFANVDSFILFNYEKLTAQQAYSLRRQLREKNIKVKVLKNSIAAIAFNKIYNTDMKELLSGPLAVAYGGDSPAEVAKELLAWSKKERKLEIQGGYIPGRVIDAKEVKALSKIPSREVLLSMIAGMFISPLRQVATILSAPLQDMTYGINAWIEKQEQGSAE